MAFDTPFKLFKRYASHEGRTADPMLVSWPAGIKARGGVRHHYLHAIDIVPTIYDCLGITPPDTVKGHVQEPPRGQLPVHLRRTRRPAAPKHPVLRHARHPRHLARRLAGQHRPPTHDLRMGPLRRRPLGAVPPRARPQPGATTSPPNNPNGWKS
jgi:arylsulfatase A-like enzyme